MMRVLHQTFHDPESRYYTPVARAVWGLIIISVVLFGVDLYLGPEAPEFALLTVIDHALLWLFGLEVTLRIGSYRPPELDLFELNRKDRLRAHLWGRLRFCTRPMILIDLITVLAVVPALRGLRALRALRLLRGAKLFRYNNPLHGILRAFEDNAILYGVSFAFLMIAVILGGVSLYLIEGPYNDGVNSLADGMWWSIVTITTVGYGDITPSATVLGRLVAGLLMVVGMFTLALFAGVVGNTLLHAVLSFREEQFRMSTLNNHVIVCGYESGARMFLDTLSREVEPETEVVIFAPGERPMDIPPLYTWVSGEPTKESELDKIRLTHARTVVILGSRKVSPQHADATTILTAFTMRAYLRHNAERVRKELVYIVAEILDEENVEHAMTAGVDEPIESTRVGFSLLAHASMVPGTARIMGQLAVMEDNNLYIGEMPIYVDSPLSFNDLVKSVKGASGALVIGVRDNRTDTDHINPENGMKVTRDYQLIYIATTVVL